jgi:hypothetical protein
VAKVRSTIFLAPLPVFKHFQMLDRSWGLQITIERTRGLNCEAGRPPVLSYSKKFLKSSNSLEAVLESLPSKDFIMKQ